MFENIKSNWNAITRYIKDEYDLTEVSYENWIKPLTPYSMHKDEEKNLVLKVMLSDNNPILKDIVSKKYRFLLQVAIQEITDTRCNIELINEDDIKKTSNTSSTSLINKEKNFVDRGILTKSNLNPKYTFDAFVVGKNNNMAHAAALAVAESPGTMYNPLFIYGGPGLGKTHLMQSIAHFILEKNPLKKVLYVPSETFTSELIEAIRKGTTTEFKEKYRSTDIFLLDDVQFIIGKERTQEEFFNTFNEMYQSNKQIIISSDRPPKEFDTLDERLRSRFEMGLPVDIQSPDYETRMAILRKKEETEGYNIDNEVIKYIASNIKSNIRELEGALNKIVFMSKLDHSKEVNVEFAKEVLKDSIYPDEKHVITPEEIINVVCDHFQISRDDLLGSKRSKEIVYPRHITMYLIRNMTNASFEDTGKYLGGRDHSTIMHGYEKISTDVEHSNESRGIIEILKKKLGN